MLQKFLLVAMSSEFFNSRLVSVFCTTNGMYFVNMPPEIIFVYPLPLLRQLILRLTRLPRLFHHSQAFGDP